jgi:hypothetical protein
MTSLRSIIPCILTAVILFLASLSPLPVSAREGGPVISQGTIDSTVAALIKDRGEKEAQRIRKGVQQVANKWLEEDGSSEIFTRFCRDQFMSEKDAGEYLKRADNDFECLNGLFQEMYLHINEPLQVDNGPIMPVDYLFSTVAPWAHITDDLFQSKVAFAMLLNYPICTLEEKMTLGEKWTKEEWARERLAEMFNFHISAQAFQQATMAYTEADGFFNSFYIMMNNIVTADGKHPFPEGHRLSAHWGLRDSIRDLYQQKDGLKKQELLAKVLECYNSSEIPKGVINCSEVDWEPFHNKVFAGGRETSPAKSDLARYVYYKKIFEATRAVDQYFPEHPTILSRAFSLDLEIPEKDVEAQFISVLTSPAVKKTAKLISKRIGRPLKPFDIWYGGFHSPNALPDDKMNEIVAKHFGNVDAMNKNLPEILTRLGFQAERARAISSKIVVEPSRGAGEAVAASLPKARAHMRIHIDKKGLNYKDYRRALYLLGQCVMQVMANESKGYSVMRGVPDQAFTEAFALVFITRDLKGLGLDTKDPSTKSSEILNALWSSYERSGASLVALKLWRWMYAHPKASSEEIRNATLAISKEVWNAYFAPVIGEKDSTLLAVYSNLITADLYVLQHSLGRIIQFQIEQKIGEKGLASEMERMIAIGKVTPDLWMKSAVGAPISANALLKASEQALKEMGAE